MPRWALCIPICSGCSAGRPWNVPWMASIRPSRNWRRKHLHGPSSPLHPAALRRPDTRHAGRPYYEKWDQMTLNRLPRELVDLLPALARFVPPA